MGGSNPSYALECWKGGGGVCILGCWLGSMHVLMRRLMTGLNLILSRYLLMNFDIFHIYYGFHLQISNATQYVHGVFIILRIVMTNCTSGVIKTVPKTLRATAICRAGQFSTFKSYCYYFVSYIFSNFYFIQTKVKLSLS